MVLNSVPIPYADSVKYLGFMITPSLNDNIDMLMQLDLSMLAVTQFYDNLLSVMHEDKFKLQILIPHYGTSSFT